jgi:hypothetical protein
MPFNPELQQECSDVREKKDKTNWATVIARERTCVDRMDRLPRRNAIALRLHEYALRSPIFGILGASIWSPGKLATRVAEITLD